MRSTGRSAKRLLWAVPAVVAAATLAFVGPAGVAQALPAAAVAAAGSPAGAAGTTEYAIGKPVCHAPTARNWSCDAVRRVEVRRGTPGAEPFVVGAGAVSAGTLGPAGGLTPSDLVTAYKFGTTGGTGQKVAVVDAYNDPNINADLQVFDSKYGLSTCSEANGCLKVFGQTGTSTLPANDTTGWSAEETLDVETVHSICQHCTIDLVEANSQAASDLGAAADVAATTLHATEVSNSYGGPESGSFGTEAADYNHSGVVITASSADDGYDDYDLLDSGGVNVPNSPASFNTVVAVGGTSLYLGQTATRESEAVWNDNGLKDYYERNFGQPLGAGGGGCSTLTSAPAWQTGAKSWAQTGCGTHRLVADISADADYLTGLDVYDTYTCSDGCLPSGWTTLGGTSLASPIIASAFALAGGAQGVAYPAKTLYSALGTKSLYDVTSGGDGYCDGEGAASCGDPNTLGDGVLDCDYPATGTKPSTGDRACDALAGFDGPSGVGTPIGLGAFKPAS